MISALARCITEVLCTSYTIEENDIELYQYGFFLLLSRVFYFVITVLFGLMFRALMESIMFYIMFSLLRSYAGGIHAKTESACTIMTIFAMFISVACIATMKSLHTTIVPIVMLTVGLACILTLSPLDTNEKPLSEVDRKKFRRITWVLSFGLVMLSMVSAMTYNQTVPYASSCAMFLEGCLLILGKAVRCWRNFTCRLLQKCRFFLQFCATD